MQSYITLIPLDVVAAVGLVVGGVSGGHVHRVARAGVGAETLTHDAAGLPHGVQWLVAVIAYKIVLTTLVGVDCHLRSASFLSRD